MILARGSTMSFQRGSTCSFLNNGTMFSDSDHCIQVKVPHAGVVERRREKETSRGRGAKTGFAGQP